MGDCGEAFLWRNGHFIRLNSLLPPNSGWVLQKAYAINDAGQIVGEGKLNGRASHGWVLNVPSVISDCDQDGIPDSCEIANGTASDLNANAIPDQCESFAPGDVNGNGIVDVDDLLFIINAWGNCPAAPTACAALACPADVFPSNGNGLIDVDDLLFVINHWG